MTEILNHFELGKARLLEQFKGLPNIEGLLKALLIPVQELEGILFDMYDSRSILSAVGTQLDLYGAMLVRPRNGITDDEQYRVVLLAKIAQNISQGTAEDIKAVYRLLMRAQYVQYAENPSLPATFSLNAINSNPIGNVADIKAAVASAKAGGTRLEFLESIPGPPFVFLDDPDPNGRGFGDANDSTIGGLLSTII